MHESSTLQYNSVSCRSKPPKEEGFIGILVEWRIGGCYSRTQRNKVKQNTAQVEIGAGL